VDFLFAVFEIERSVLSNVDLPSTRSNGADQVLKPLLSPRQSKQTRKEGIAGERVYIVISHATFLCRLSYFVTVMCDISGEY